VGGQPRTGGDSEPFADEFGEDVSGRDYATGRGEKDRVHESAEHEDGGGEDRDLVWDGRTPERGEPRGGNRNDEDGVCDGVPHHLSGDLHHMGILRRICDDVVLAIRVSFDDDTPLERDPPPVRGDVTAKSEEDEGIEQEGKPGGGEHEEILESVSLRGVFFCHPAPQSRNTIEGSLLRGREDAGSEGKDEPKNEPDGDESGIAGPIRDPCTIEQKEEGVNSDDQ